MKECIWLLCSFVSDGVTMNNMILDHRYVAISIDVVAMTCQSPLGWRPFPSPIFLFFVRHLFLLTSSDCMQANIATHHEP